MVKLFNDFLEEGYNFITSEIGDIEFEDRWFYYDDEDEIIYGCDDEPINVNNLFYFNPVSCKIVIDEHVYDYDINNPICLIVYNFHNNKVEFYKENEVLNYLKDIGYKSNENFNNHKNDIQTIFDEKDDYKFLLMNGKKIISTTFDIIEEN